MLNDAESTLITSRSEFHAAIRLALVEAARAGSRELMLCDPNFLDWPLSEPAVIETLGQWASSHRRMTLLASDFDGVVRRHARWIAWRRTWSHIVTCRTNPELESGAFPTLLVASGTMSVHMSDTVHHRGRISRERADELRTVERFDAVLQRSNEGFSSTTTGL